MAAALCSSPISISGPRPSMLAREGDADPLPLAAALRLGAVLPLAAASALGAALPLPLAGVLPLAGGLIWPPTSPSPTAPASVRRNRRAVRRPPSGPSCPVRRRVRAAGR